MPKSQLSWARRSGIWGAANEAVLNKVLKTYFTKSPLKLYTRMLCFKPRLNPILVAHNLCMYFPIREILFAWSIPFLFLTLASKFDQTITKMWSFIPTGWRCTSHSSDTRSYTRQVSVSNRMISCDVFSTQLNFIMPSNQSMRLPSTFSVKYR
jgi:hypothetical protein